MVCHNRKYVSLVDRSTFPIGWGVINEMLADPVLPNDGEADFNQVFLIHTRFAEVTTYGAEFGSGIKDSCQNCYLPSQGPDIGGYCNVTQTQSCSQDSECTSPEFCVLSCNPATGLGCCGAIPTAPYCCDGIAIDQDAWEESDCFTGY